jgi:predicted RNA-binding protein
MMESAPRYWIIIASRDHVQTGVAGGFAQANHGKSSPLKRMRPGDWVIYYSSKERFGEDEKCQRFTAIGQVKPGEVYTGSMGEGWTPNRRDVDYKSCAEASILPLIPTLLFIKDKQRWGAPFRFGMLEIDQDDFQLIARRMLKSEAV